MHSEGPWCFEAENGRAHPRVYGADNSLIAEVGNANLMRWEVWDHDARLIAAAPDGLEMAREISKQYDNQDLNHVDFRVMAKQLADAFIAKATEPRP